MARLLNKRPRGSRTLRVFDDLAENYGQFFATHFAASALSNDNIIPKAIRAVFPASPIPIRICRDFRSTCTVRNLYHNMAIICSSPT
jgi:hypothetical protein